LSRFVTGGWVNDKPDPGADLEKVAFLPIDSVAFSASRSVGISLDRVTIPFSSGGEVATPMWKKSKHGNIPRKDVVSARLFRVR
jgi:hypothetical protein